MKNQLLKEYIKSILLEAKLEDVLQQTSSVILIGDVIDLFNGKLKKERFKKVGVGIIKFCSLGAIDAFDAAKDLTSIIDQSGAIKDAIAETIIQAASSMGLDKAVSKLSEKPKKLKRDIINLDPYYSAIIDNKIEAKFLKDYIAFLESHRETKLKDFIKNYGDITQSLESWLEKKYEGRKLDTEREEQDLY
jgi:hypothetical protein